MPIGFEMLSKNYSLQMPVLFGKKLALEPERLQGASGRMQTKEGLIRENAVNGICDIALVLLVVGLHIIIPV